MAKKSTKIFVLDTNVILHDATCITQFEEHDVVIPITVIEEMDKFKRGSQMINLNAREFARTLDSLSGSALFNGGISLGRKRGRVSVSLTRGLNDVIREVFREDNSDHRILSAAYDLKLKFNSNRQVVLVTKDVNMRMKAKSLGIFAEDYNTDKISSIDELYSGKEVIDNFNDDILVKFFDMPYEVPLDTAFKKYKGELVPNKY